MNGARPNLRHILRSVSRSFYLSIRLLPADLRKPVQLAYLFARATDTVADTHSIDVGTRMGALTALTDAIAGAAPEPVLVDLEQNFAPLQHDPSERNLIEALPSLFELLDASQPEDGRDIRELLAKITRGQMLDLQRFGSAAQLSCLASADELREYTYLVAGCVGEFWTRLCRRHVATFPRDAEMEQLGREYGDGLQLINILRDAHADLASGRCYFPKDELESLGLHPSEITHDSERFLPIYRKWLDAARSGIEAGMKYVERIESRRVRVATALPALIGIRTLSLLQQAGARALREKIKVPRGEVRGIIAKVVFTGANRATLRRMFEHAL